MPYGMLGIGWCNALELKTYAYMIFSTRRSASFFVLGLSVPEVALISEHKDYRMLARYTHMIAESVGCKLDAS